jgi:hypothetical protein
MMRYLIPRIDFARWGGAAEQHQICEVVLPSNARLCAKAISALAKARGEQ